MRKPILLALLPFGGVARSLQSNDCNSPFGYGGGERNRLINCGTGDIVVAAYDSDVEFSKDVLSLIVDSITYPHRSEALLQKKFQFYVEAESGACTSPQAQSLCQLLKCNAMHTAAVGQLAVDEFFQPWTAPFETLASLCSQCNEEYLGNCSRQYQGGSGSGAGFQIYCTNLYYGYSIELMDGGGGGGGGASNGQFGGGGGGGVDVDIPHNYQLSCGGGCGSNFDTCNSTRKLEPRNANSSNGMAYQDGHRQLYDVCDDNGVPGFNPFLSSDEGCIVNVCGSQPFVNAVNYVKAAIHACQNDPYSKISLTAGGGGGGSLQRSSSSKTLYSFSTGFTFSAGPAPFTNSSGQPDSQLLASCSYSYATALCTNAGYTDQATNFALCTCPVQQLYNPTYSCPSPSSGGTAITEADITANCDSWCPSGVVSTNQTCPTLLPACSCKT